MDATLLCDADGIVIAWSSCAEALLGWTREEAIGKSLVNLVIPLQYRSVVESNVREFCATGAGALFNRRLEAVLLCKDRHAILIEFMATPIRLDDRLYFNASIRARHPDAKSAKDPARHISILNLSRDAIMITNLEHEILFWNSGAEKMFGYAAEESLGRKSHELLSAEYPLALSEINDQLMATGHWEGEISYTTFNGVRLTILSRWELESDAEDGTALILKSGTDAGLWKNSLVASTLLLTNKQHFESLFKLHPDGFFSFDPGGRLISANAALSTLTGYSNEELIGMPHKKLVAPENIDEIRHHFFAALRGTPQTCEFICVRKDNSRFDASIIMLPDIVDNAVHSLNGIVKDVSHRKDNERRILFLATHDPLTGLPNRVLLNDRMQHAIDQARRRQSRVGILLMDLNRFKVINDSLGHNKGDILLCTIADRLKGAMREVDTVARLGGDEFVVLLENLNAADDLSLVAQNLLALVAQPVVLDNESITVSTSIGASIYPQDGNDTATLLKNADLAMYDAKESGSSVFRPYSPEMNTRAVGRLARENGLRQALERGELVLHYQPRLDIGKNRIVGIEALVRWDHPEKGLIFPVNFIPLAEEIGVIDAIGKWVLLEACRQLKAWQDAGLLSVNVSVNVSAVQLRSDTICSTISHALAATGLDPGFLDLEITESSLMQNIDDTQEKLLDIRRLGVSLSIDDFGTGYSSLSYLKRLPIDTLKIDKSFIREVVQNSDDSAIVTATIAMAHSMNLKVVAEGVTTFDQMRFLESCGCDEIQGYLLCQPLPESDAESFLKTSQSRGIYFSRPH
ncbi:MAG: hypothetical protein JWQ21_983 [Herminiimonas sp.]|nr:hypothetical protein [Herminiimonas sp.]